jgi:hypothetical protein
VIRAKAVMFAIFRIRASRLRQARKRARKKPLEFIKQLIHGMQTQIRHANGVRVRITQSNP